jgi:hypothetical protein
VLIEDLGFVAAAGKDGILYVVKTNNMGKTRPAELDAPAGDISTLIQLFFQRTHYQHAAPICWRSPEHGTMLFCWGENGNLRAWSLGANGLATYLACSAEVASAQSPMPPGGMMRLSADGATANSAVLWACIPYLDAKMMVSPGWLFAYDATAFGTFGDGSKQLRVLWDRQDWNLPFSFYKFTPPVVANGKLYVPTHDARVEVYGLA